MTKPTLPDGLVAFVKRDCPTCELVGSVLADVEMRAGLTTYTQDDPTFPEAVSQRIDDTELAVSWHHDIETVPTLIRVENGEEVEFYRDREISCWEPIPLVAREKPMQLDMPVNPVMAEMKKAV